MFLTLACNRGSDPEYYAERFCDCSEEFSKAAVQLKTGTIDRVAYEQLKAEQEACMGDADPLEDLKDDPEALQQFKTKFLEALSTTCPATARNLGFE